MSPQLKQFYKDLQQWVEAGLPEDPIFKQQDSVYDNLCFWAYFGKLNSIELRYELRYELRSSFEKAGLDEWAPFNASIWEACEEENKYTNKARLEWIRKHAMED